MIDDGRARASDGPAGSLFSRDEVLGGLPARRARALLFLIESRTAHLVAKSRQAMAFFLTEQAERERDLVFLEAFTLGRDPPLRPTIQDLESQAAHWAPLVPANPQVRAALAHLLGAKYTFTERSAPGIRAALELEGEPVQRAYQRLYRRPLGVIYAPRVGAAEQLRWAATGLAGRLERLPPFWTAYALTLTETVGAGVLALPIAVAGIGPLAAVALLILLGFINMLTVAAMAEAAARNGSVRYGNAFFGRLVADYLGNTGSAVLSVALTVMCAIVLLAYYIGLSTTLASATMLPAELWSLALFLLVAYFLSRRSLSATVTSALLVGAATIGLILALSLLALVHLQPTHLLYVGLPLLGGRPFDPAILRLIFGVVLLAYFGHLSIGNCARVVLRRDPSARSLIWGTVAAQGTAMGIYCLWVVAVNGAIAHEALVGQSGTALGPLADEVGPIVHVLGAIFVVLAMGMASVHYSLSLFNLVQERLPARRQPMLELARRRGRLLFRPGGKPAGAAVGLTYLGLASGQPCFRLDVQAGGGVQRFEAAARGRWEATEVLERISALRPEDRLRLAVDVLEADDEHVRLRLEASVAPTYEGGWDEIGLRLPDVLSLADSERQLVNWLVRRGEASLAEVAARMGQGQTAARTTLEELVERGLVRRTGNAAGPRYRAGLTRKRGRQLPGRVWEALGEETGPAAGRARTGAGIGNLTRGVRAALLSERGRFVLSASPVLGVFLFVEWLLLSRAESFAEPLSLGGVIAGSVIAGVFPVLLLIASERKSDFGLHVHFRLHGLAVVKVALYVFFLAGLLLHGLIIWEGPVERGAALLVAALALGATARMIIRRAFDSRLVVELREDLGIGGGASFAITDGGRPAPAKVRLSSVEGDRDLAAAGGEVPVFASLLAANFQLPAGPARELKVWVHRVTPEGDSEGLAALLEVHDGADTRRFDLGLSGGQAVLPISGGDCGLAIALGEDRT